MNLDGSKTTAFFAKNKTDTQNHHRVIEKKQTKQKNIKTCNLCLALSA